MAEKHVHKVYGSFPPWGKSVEFPASGGGGDRYIEAWDGNGNSTLIQFYPLVKTFLNNKLIIIPPAAVSQDVYAKNNAVAVYYNSAQKASDATNPNMLIPIDDLFEDLPGGGEDMTKEEFYDMDVVVVENFQYKFDKGMTWEEWCNSKYNTRGEYIKDGTLYGGRLDVPLYYWGSTSGNLVYATDEVQAGVNIRH